MHDPNDPTGRLLYSVLAMVAEFEADLIRLRTRRRLNVAHAKKVTCAGCSRSSAPTRPATSRALPTRL